jgi:hypothetical protein
MHANEPLRGPGPSDGEDVRARVEAQSRVTGVLAGRPLEVPWRYGDGGPSAALVGVPFLLGALYMGLRWAVLGPSAMAGGFVGLLLGATFLLVAGMRGMKGYVEVNAIPFFRHARPDRPYDQLRLEAGEFVARIFDARRMTLAGVAYGALVAAAPILFDLGPGEVPLRAALVLFLFSVNFVAGVGLYGLARFVFKVWRLRELVRVTIWDRRNRSTEFIDGVRVRTALLVSGYTALSFSAVVVSDIPVEDVWVMAYFLFAASLVLGAFAMPGMFIRRRIEEEKLSALGAIDLELDAEFGRALERARDPDGPVDLARIEELLAFRSKVEGIGVWPVGWRSIRTGIGVVMMSALPILVQRVLERL